jgi:hypothetical protein
MLCDTPDCCNELEYNNEGTTCYHCILGKLKKTVLVLIRNSRAGNRRVTLEKIKDLMMEVVY